MKPDWDKLAEAFAGSASQLIADVDCDGAGEPLCQDNGIEGFPTLKYGDPSDLQDYEGERDFDTLKAFADENLKPQCSPFNTDLCSDEKKAEIKKYMAMTKGQLEDAIEDKEDQLEKIDDEFSEFVQHLQTSYEETMEKVSKEKDEIKKSGLSLMKAVRASLAQKEAGNDEL